MSLGGCAGEHTAGGREELLRARGQWEAGPLAEALSRLPERRRAFDTASGLTVERLYTPLDLDGLDYTTDLGFPGQFPFTRGVRPTMYRGRLWTMRQYAGFGTAEETNARFRYLLEQGQTGLSVAFDLPTQMGYDADHPLALGEVGRVGVAVSSAKDVQAVFRGLPLEAVTTSMTINAPAAVLLAMYVVVAEDLGVPRAKLRGTVQNDVLKEYVARGTYIFPPRPSLRLAADLCAFCAAEMPDWNGISVSGYHMREAGATAAQEVAFTLANAMAYLGAVAERGIGVDRVAPRVSFFFSAGLDLLEEVAKFRAARRLWARIARHRLGANDPRSWAMRFHAQTAGSALTAQQPENNVVRVALQALGAVLGGCQSLHTNSMDEALSLPSEQAARTALRTQQIIAFETGVAETVDPLAGSYAVETMTTAIEREAGAYLDRIAELGGAVEAIERGYLQSEIHESAYRAQREVEAGRRTVVGLNAFREREAPLAARWRPRPEVEREQRERLAAWRRDRDGAAARLALESLTEAARGEGNLMPPIIEAVRSGATLGEICGVLRSVFGEYRPPSVI